MLLMYWRESHTKGTVSSVPLLGNCQKKKCSGQNSQFSSFNAEIDSFNALCIKIQRPKILPRYSPLPKGIQPHTYNPGIFQEIFTGWH